MSVQSEPTHLIQWIMYNPDLQLNHDFYFKRLIFHKPFTLQYLACPATLALMNVTDFIYSSYFEIVVSLYNVYT